MRICKKLMNFKQTGSNSRTIMTKKKPKNRFKYNNNNNKFIFKIREIRVIIII